MMLDPKISPVVMLLSCLAITACVPRAENVAPMPIPSANYKGLSCDETKTALRQKRVQQYALASHQDSAASGGNSDGVVVLLPVGSLSGENKQEELARVKGEVLALERAAVINCKSKPKPIRAKGPIDARDPIDAKGRVLPEKNAATRLPAPDPFCAVPPCYTTPSMEQRLAHLKSLYDKKLITAAEYEAKRQDILKDF